MFLIINKVREVRGLFLQPYDLVAEVEDFFAMGDADNGLVGEGGADVVEHCGLGVGVKGGGGLVEQEHGCINQECAGYTQTLCLSFAEGYAVFAALGGEALLETGDEVGLGEAQCLKQLFVGGIGCSELQVGAYGSAKEGVALWHIGEVVACGGGDF